MNKIKITLLFLSIIVCSALSSQNFTELTSANLTGVSLGSVAWGDYDNDGDLDIILTGADNYGPLSKIYRNDAGTFVDINASIVAVSESSVDWGDYDNDGDLDILLMGRNAQLSGVAKIYRNDAGSFVDQNITLPAIFRGAAKWGDYDNDGDLDFIMMGNIGAVYVTYIYRNDSTGFTLIIPGIIGLNYGDVDWGDYDNDGDLDIAITGDVNNTRYSRIYRNDTGTFTDISAGLIDLIYSSVAWGDYDNDGDLDLLLTGWSTGLNYSKLYNNNSGVFSDINGPFVGIQHGCAEFADYDNDGDLDIIVCGKYGSTKVTNLYQNNSGTYSWISSGFPGVEYSSVGWADYDNDGDLDILISGVDVSPITKIFTNNSTIANTPPSAPTNLISTVDTITNSVTLSWDKSSDTQTAQNGLTYNLYFGTSPAAIDFISPMSNISTGFRKVVKFGNNGHSTSYVIENLDYDTYYWSVQAIDNAFAGSAFAVEDTFEIKLDDTFLKESISGFSYKIFPNPAQDYLNIEINENNSSKVSVSIFNAIGKRIIFQELEEAKILIETGNFNKGLYYIKIELENNSICEKFVKI